MEHDRGLITFQMAIQQGNVVKVQQFIDAGVTIQGLMLAVKTLLKRRYEKGKPDFANNIAVIEVLLKAGEDPDTLIVKKRQKARPLLHELIDAINRNPMLSFCLQENNPIWRDAVCKVIKLLIDYNADLEVIDTITGVTPLTHALHGHNLNIAKYLIDKEVLITKRDKDDATVLHLSCRANFYELVKIFVSKGIGVNLKDRRGCMALDYARDNLDITLFLLHHSATATHRDDLDIFCDAARKEHQALLDYLFEHRNIALFKRESGQTALHDPQLKEELILRLLQNKANINVIDSRGNTPLFYVLSWLAGTKLILPRLQLFSQYGARFNVMNKKQETLLHNAIRCNTEDIEYLIQQGIPLNARNNEGQTVLHLAIRRCPVKTGIFLQYNIDVNIKDAQGRVALEVYNYRYDCNISASIAILLKRYPKGRLPSNANMLLIMAAWFNRQDIIAELLDRGINLDATYQERTALSNTIYGGHSALFLWLIEKKVTIKQENLHDAVRFLRLDMVKKLIDFGVSDCDAKVLSILINEMDWLFDCKQEEIPGKLRLSFAIFKILLQQYKDVDKKMSNGKTMLEQLLGYLQYNQSKNIIWQFIRYLIILNCKLPNKIDDQSVLTLFAVKFKSFDVLGKMLSNPANVEVAAVEAIRQNDRETLSLLVNKYSLNINLPIENLKLGSRS